MIYGNTSRPTPTRYWGSAFRGIRRWVLYPGLLRLYWHLPANVSRTYEIPPCASRISNADGSACDADSNANGDADCYANRDARYTDTTPSHAPAAAYPVSSPDSVTRSWHALDR